MFGAYQGAGCRVQGARSRVQGSGFKVQGSRFKVQGLGFMVQCLGCKVQGLGDQGFRVQGQWSRVKVNAAPQSGSVEKRTVVSADESEPSAVTCRVEDLGLRVQVQGSGFRV